MVAHQANDACQYSGLDIDPKVREIAKKKLSSKGLSIPLDLYDGSVFPYPDNHFDKVFSSLVFHQLNGLLPEFITKAGFTEVNEPDFINTRIGTYSYYTATKPPIND